MKRTKTNAKNIRLWQKTSNAASMTALLVMMIFGNLNTAFAQPPPAFIGDYDRSFNAPNGYFVDPMPPDPTGSFATQQSSLYTGELLPDGSIVAGGRFLYRPTASNSQTGDFWLRKFTPAGTPDTSFGTNGYVRTNFNIGHPSGNGPSDDVPYVLKVQSDGKIVFAGSCFVHNTQPNAGYFGWDVCLVRYNANGTLDETFGGGIFFYGNFTDPYRLDLHPGTAIIMSGTRDPNQTYGTEGIPYDMTIQPDGKIVVVGSTRHWNSVFSARGYGAFIARFNPNGLLDTTFGDGGIARLVKPAPTCSPSQNLIATTRFLGVRLQPDGRIIAVGHDGFRSNANCNFEGEFFFVTRWSAAGQLETVRRLDNNTDFGQQERAVSAHLTRDGSKVIVSGSYRFLGENPAGWRNKMTMVRFNLSDLSLDTSFGNGGIVQYNIWANSWVGSTLYISAIQPDGKIIGVDNAGQAGPGRTVRFNPNGSVDQSFGNQLFDGVINGGRLYTTAPYPGCGMRELEAARVLVRPNGRINLIGSVFCGQTIGAVSQQFTVFENGIYNDFENDGRTNIAVFRPNDGVWHTLNSTNNSYSPFQWGAPGDKIAPADYDGDGRTDRAVFRNGNWYIFQSSNSQVRILQFGIGEDLPRPGDFDGDGKADIGVFRPSSGIWVWLRSSDNGVSSVQFGAAGDVPLLADFDGDGKTDPAVYRGGIWYVLQSSNSQTRSVSWGIASDVPVVGDYDADSKADFAVFRNGSWFVLRSSDFGFSAVGWGQSGDRAVPGDYDNDGRNDYAVFRNGTWFILRSRDNGFSAVPFGAATDTPIPAAYLP